MGGDWSHRSSGRLFAWSSSIYTQGMIFEALEAIFVSMTSGFDIECLYSFAIVMEYLPSTQRHQRVSKMSRSAQNILNLGFGGLNAFISLSSISL